jgi:hypothetical protein
MYIFTRESNSSIDDKADSLETRTNHSGDNDKPVDNIISAQLMPNDSIDEKSERLYHRVAANEKVITISSERQKHPAYSNYDFSKTIRLKDGSVAKDDIQKGELVYWNKKKSSPPAKPSASPAGDIKQTTTGGGNNQTAVPSATTSTPPSTAQGSTTGTTPPAAPRTDTSK